MRVDAAVTGDMQKRFPQLMERRLFIDQWLETASAVTSTINLSYSDLGRWLAQCPQADVEIQLTVTLDPVEGPGGST